MTTHLTKHPTAVKTLVAMVIAAFAFLAVPQTSEAGNSRRYSHKCGSCGTSIYAYPKFVGYNNCGQRVYRYVPQGHSCRHRGHSHGYSSHYDSHRRGSSKADIISGIIRGVIESKHGHRRH